MTTDVKITKPVIDVEVKMAERLINPPLLLTVSVEVYDKISEHLNKIPKRSKYYKDAQAALDEIAPRPVRYIYELNKVRNKCLDQ